MKAVLTIGIIPKRSNINLSSDSFTIMKIIKIIMSDIKYVIKNGVIFLYYI